MTPCTDVEDAEVDTETAEVDVVAAAIAAAPALTAADRQAMYDLLPAPGERVGVATSSHPGR